MPNFDGGHYFLTVLAPIRGDAFVDDDGRHRSRPDMLRAILACLPTAEQREPLPPDAPKSPFTRSKRTHLARFVVMDDVVYNGRPPSDAILSRITGENPIIPLPVDRLNRSYLFFSADIDADSGDEAALNGYLTDLWNTMGVELRALFEHCEGFTGEVKSAADFCTYVKKCQLETTMSFNDYWAYGLKATNPPFGKTVGAVAAVLAVVALVMGIGQWSSWWGWLLAALVVVALTAVFAYGYIMRLGGKPFPTAPNSDLRSILKALYLQQNFVEFAIENQGVADEDLHKNFGAFIDKHRPQDRDAPTQDPGVIRSTT